MATIIDLLVAICLQRFTLYMMSPHPAMFKLVMFPCIFVHFVAGAFLYHKSWPIVMCSLIALIVDVSCSCHMVSVLFHSWSPRTVLLSLFFPLLISGPSPGYPLVLSNSFPSVRSVCPVFVLLFCFLFGGPSPGYPLVLSNISEYSIRLLQYKGGSGSCILVDRCLSCCVLCIEGWLG